MLSISIKTNMLKPRSWIPRLIKRMILNYYKRIIIWPLTTTKYVKYVYQKLQSSSWTQVDHNEKQETPINQNSRKKSKRVTFLEGKQGFGCIKAQLGEVGLNMLNKGSPRVPLLSMGPRRRKKYWFAGCRARWGIEEFQGGVHMRRWWRQREKEMGWWGLVS